MSLTHELIKNVEIKKINLTTLVFPETDSHYSFSKPKLDKTIWHELYCNIGDNVTFCAYNYTVIEKHYDYSNGSLTIVLDYPKDKKPVIIEDKI